MFKSMHDSSVRPDRYKLGTQERTPSYALGAPSCASASVQRNFEGWTFIQREKEKVLCHFTGSLSIFQGHSS